MDCIEPEKLKEALELNGMDSVLVDVRDPKLFAEGHVPGARNIPIDDLGSNLDELKQFKTVYVTCGGGTKSGRAYEALEKEGVSVIRFQKGFRGWRDLGYPIETS